MWHKRSTLKSVQVEKSRTEISHIFEGHDLPREIRHTRIVNSQVEPSSWTPSQVTTKTMHVTKIICALLPALAYGMPSLAEVIELTPTMKELQRAYPDVDIDYISGDLGLNETYHVDSAEQRTLGYKFVAAGLSAIGYFSLGGGCDQIIKASNACTDDQGSGFECFLRGLATGTAHVLVGGAGFVGGRQFIMYFWHGGALQAAGLPPAEGKRACNTDQLNFASSTHFSGQYGLKVAGKNMHCYSPDSGQLGYVASLGSMVARGMRQQCALSTQYTIYKTSTNTVLARYHSELDSVRTDVCPFTITGGDSCTA